MIVGERLRTYGLDLKAGPSRQVSSPKVSGQKVPPRAVPSQLGGFACACFGLAPRIQVPCIEGGGSIDGRFCVTLLEVLS